MKVRDLKSGEFFTLLSEGNKTLYVFVGLDTEEEVRKMVIVPA